MKAFIVLFGLLAWIGCHEDSDIVDEQALEADATWSNMLASDGCSWHFTITKPDTTISLVPSEASKAKIDKELGKNDSFYSFTDVHLKYSYTGGKGTVPCGWGSQATYDEINIIEIHKK